MNVKIIDFLKQFILKQKTSKDIPNIYLRKLIEKEGREHRRGNFSGPFNSIEALKFLKSL